MPRRAAVAAVVLLLATAAFAQTAVTIKAVLIDRDLNQKPVAKTMISIVDHAGTTATSVRTGFDGAALVQLAPGDYRLETAAIEFDGKSVTWSVPFSVGNAPLALELSGSLRRRRRGG